MFNPVQPRPEPDPSKSQTDPDKKRIVLSSRLLIAGAVCQGLCGLFTFLSWTSDAGRTRPGYEGLPFFEIVYDGLAGKLNLGATAIALVILFVASRNPVKQQVYPFVFVIICWNLCLSVWLCVLWVRLDFWRDYGLALTIAAVIGAAGCMTGSYIAWKFEGDPLPTI